MKDAVLTLFLSILLSFLFTRSPSLLLLSSILFGFVRANMLTPAENVLSSASFFLFFCTSATLSPLTRLGSGSLFYSPDPFFCLLSCSLVSCLERTFLVPERVVGIIYISSPSPHFYRSLSAASFHPFHSTSQPLHQRTNTTTFPWASIRFYPSLPSS